jgi:hypothetical protein
LDNRGLAADITDNMILGETHELGGVCVCGVRSLLRAAVRCPRPRATNLSCPPC